MSDSKQTKEERAEAQQKLNDIELTAWNEWKTVCKILKCGQESKAALVSRMYNSAQRKLDTLLVRSCPRWKEEFADADAWGQEISDDFDRYIREGEIHDKRLNWKDHVWQKIAESKDEKLRVIRGKLTGPKSVLSNVLEKFVVKKGLLRGVVGHNKPIANGSLNVPVGTSDEESERELIDLVPAQPTSAPEIPREDQQEWRRRISGMFIYTECVVLLAHFARVAFTSPEFEKAAGFKKSTASVVLNGKFVKKNVDGRIVEEQVQEGLLDKLACLRSEFMDLAREYGRPAVYKLLVSALKDVVLTEKRSAEFLSLVKENNHEEFK